MLFKWKKTWPTICALKATPFAVELDEITSWADAVSASTKADYSSLRTSAGNSFKLFRT